MTSKEITFRNYSRIFALIAIVLLFFITRLTHLTILPIFNDEAIYIRWAIMISEGLDNILIPVQIESKKPLFMWLTAVLLKVFNDPLWAGRIVSVTAGFFSLVGIFLIGRKIHSLSAGCIAALFYVVCPYYLFFDRMAHQDGLLNCFFIWLLLISLVIFQEKGKNEDRNFLALGFVIGLNLLTKATAILYVLLPLLLKLILFTKSKSVSWKKISTSSLLGLIIGLFPQAAHFFTTTNTSLKDIFIPIQTTVGQSSIVDSLLKIPRNIYFSFGSPVEYFVTYLTLPVFLLAVLFFVFQYRVFNRSTFIVLTYFVVPFFLILGIGGAGFSRYFLFCGIPLLLWAALAFNFGANYLQKLAPKKPAYLMITLLLIFLLYPAAKFDYKLLTNPEDAPFVGRDYGQYINNEFSGYGVPEAIKFFKQESKDKNIAIFTTPNWGNPADPIHIYLSDYPDVKAYKAFWVFGNALLPSDASKIIAKDKFGVDFEINVRELSNIYFICNSVEFERSVFLMRNKNFKWVRSFEKPNSTVSLDIYKRI